MKKIAFVLVCLLLTANVYAVYASGPIESNFEITLVDMKNVQGGGSGGAEWYYYPNTNWWNIWFYDHPLKFDPWHKVVDYTFTVQPIDPTKLSFVQFTLNWSKPEWSPNPNSPPLPPLTPEEEASFIQRDSLSLGYQLTKPITITRNDYTLPVPYNPEWISIDVRGSNFQMSGTIWHECIPEPVSAALLAIGALFINRRK